MSAQFRNWTVYLEAEFGPEDITERVARLVSDSGVTTGIVTVAMAGSTGAITTIEYEPGALHDLRRALDTLAPANDDYDHNARWGDGNGFSHIRSALLKTSLSVPIVDGRLYLGTWQQLMTINFDNRPRSREIAAVIIGE